LKCFTNGTSIYIMLNQFLNNMKVQSSYIPVIVPASFEEWKKKHFYNPDLKPISYSHFRKRGKAPKLSLKYYNHKFNEEPEKPNQVKTFLLELAEIPKNVKTEYKLYIKPLFA
jgi:hypothetical protein